jgi:hypothetical protein
MELKIEWRNLLFILKTFLLARDVVYCCDLRSLLHLLSLCVYRHLFCRELCTREEIKTKLFTVGDAKLAVVF